MSYMHAEKSPLAEAIEHTGLTNNRVNRLCKKHGITRAHLVSYGEGTSRPAPWLAREIAKTFGLDATALIRAESDSEDWS